MQRTGADVDEVLAAVAPPARRRDALTLAQLLREITGREPEMWSGSIVGFGACHYRYPTGTEGDSPMIGFAARKTSLTVYLLDGIAAHEEDLAALGPHRTGVGCLYLGPLDGVDPGRLRSILEASYRTAEAGGSGEYAELTPIH